MLCHVSESENQRHHRHEKLRYMYTEAQKQKHHRLEIAIGVMRKTTIYG